MAELVRGISRPAHFSTTSALARAAIRWITRGTKLKAVNLAQLLDGTHGDGSEHAEIREYRDQSSQTEACPLNGSEFHTAADDFIGNHINFTHVEGIHSVIAADG